MSSNPLISIIVPVYNNEKYIKGCINSLLCQSYENIEVIVINDGSTDSTSRVLSKNYSDNPRVKIIEKENCGVSAARNDGLRASTGELIAFCDSDDEYLPDAFESMIDEFDENTDYLVCSHRKTWIRTNDEIRESKVMTKSDVYDNFIDYNIVFNFIWANLYRSSIIKDNNLLFNEDICYAEDYEFNLNYIKHINQVIRISDNVVYNYYISRSGEHEKIFHPDLDIKAIFDFFDGKEHTPENVYNFYVGRRLYQCLDRYICSYPTSKAAELTEQAYKTALPYANDETLLKYFTKKQVVYIKNGDYLALAKSQKKKHKNLALEKLRFSLSKLAVKLLNKTERIR